jgi:beta-glucosidase
VTISADVTNRGTMDGDEVVQLYLTHEGEAGAALQELHGFQRIHLARGQTKTGTFTIRDCDLSVVETDGQRRIVNGTVKTWIGGGQPPGRQKS